MSYTNTIKVILRKINVPQSGGDPRAYQDDLEFAEDKVLDELVRLGSAAIDDMIDVFKTTKHQGLMIRVMAKIGDAKAIAALESLAQDTELGAGLRQRINTQLSSLKSGR